MPLSQVQPNLTEQSQTEEIALLEGILGKQDLYNFPKKTLSLFQKAIEMAKNGGYGFCPKCRKRTPVEELKKSPFNCFYCGAELIQEEDQENLV